MQVYTNSNRVSLKTILFFLVVLLLAYLPIASFLFSLKNDAFTGYFPPKFFMSESIHSGHLPLWNPYINFGFPAYGDMSGGYWSPITWLVASTVGYNAYTFTIELLLYIILGGIGMYKYTGLLVFNKEVGLIAAVAFICGGYNIGHLQHFNWVSGAAFFPWCLWSYTILLQKFSLKNILFTALLFYMLLSSAHPGISIAAMYFFGAYLLFFFWNGDKTVPVFKRINQQISTHLLLFVALGLIALGMLLGYLDILAHFVRGQKISLADALLQPTTGASWISILFPFATVKNDSLYTNDISMRNGYFSLTLLLFFIHALLNKKNVFQRFFFGYRYFFYATICWWSV